MALFSFEHEEADPKTLKRRIETILAKATAQRLKQIYGHVRQVMESLLITQSRRAGHSGSLDYELFVPG